MNLSPADFAAYSRATGAPYPESPEEQMEMYPLVRNFRKNQLQPPQQQESNSLALGLGIGLGLAGLGAGAMRLRGRGNKAPKKDVAGKSSVKMTDLSDQPIPKSKTAVYADVAAKAEGDFTEYTPPRGELTERDVYPRMRISEEGYLDYPEVSKQTEAARRLYRSKDRSIINQNRQSTYQGEIPGVQADLTALRSKEVSPFATQEELSQLGVVQSAPSRSLSIAPDQQSLFDYGQDVGRVDSLLKDLQADVRREAGQMTGTESNRQSAIVRKLEREEEKQAKNILSELAQETPTLTETYEAFGEPAAQVQNIEALNTASDQAAAPVERAVQRNEDVDAAAAQSFLNEQRQKLAGKGLSPTRVERVLASNPELIEAAELYASTGDKAVLSRFSEQPSSPVTVKPKSVISLEGDELATGSLFKPGKFGEFVDDLEGKDVDLTNRISSIGAEQQELIGRRKQLEEDSLMIKSAMDREPSGQDSYSRMYGQMQYELQNMPEPASLNVDLGDAMAERDNVRAQLKGLKELGAQQFLKDQTEGSRAFYEVNPATNEIIPETLEIRSGRKSIEQQKGGGGRNTPEFTAGMREPDLKQRTVLVPVNKSAVERRRPGAVFGPYPKDSLPTSSSITVKTRSSDDVGNQLTGFEGDRTQTGGQMGLYGPERTERKGERATAGQRPTQVTEDELINQALMDSTPDEFGIPTPPDRDLVFVDTEKYRRPSGRVIDSLKASEAVRRANIEGRDPQMVLRSMGFGV